MLLASLTAMTIAIGIVVCDTAPNPAEASSAATASPKASPSASPSKNDPCGATKSKWAHVQCQEFNASAPGDEYFGRLKISYLGIDNTFKDGAISAGAYTVDPNLIKKLMFADEALQRWAAKYPNDPQLPRSYFLGIQVFRKVYTQPGQDLAWHYMQILITKYPSTYFGKNTKASIANGYTEHWFALAQLCPTPLPKGVKPEKTPSATPSPSPSPGQPAIDLITPPCVQPSPVASPEPSASPSYQPSSRASPSYQPSPPASPSAQPSSRPSPSASPQSTRLPMRKAPGISRSLFLWLDAMPRT